MQNCLANFGLDAPWTPRRSDEVFIVSIPECHHHFELHFVSNINGAKVLNQIERRAWVAAVCLCPSESVVVCDGCNGSEPTPADSLVC